MGRKSALQIIRRKAPVTPTDAWLRKILAPASAVVVVVTLLLGLWPYQPLSSSGIAAIWQTIRGSRSLFPQNEVRWLASGPGIQFGQHGSIFSESEFHPGGTTGCALEIWMEPTKRDDEGTILAFSRGKGETPLRIRQYHDLLMVFHYPGKPAADNEEILGINHTMQPDRRVLITVSSDTKETAVYVNGEFARKATNLSLGPADLEGTSVIGDSPDGYNPWTGIMRGLAIYDGPLSATEVHEHARRWQRGDGKAIEGGRSLRALYLFQEGHGDSAQSAIGGAPKLTIPKAFKKLHPVLLNPVWKEYGTARDFVFDAVENVVGFVPLGLVVCLYLSLRWGQAWGRSRLILWTIFLGLIVSLTIELGQYFLPLRSSGTTDLITNTAGTALGAWLAISWVRSGKSLPQLGTPQASRANNYH